MKIVEDWLGGRGKDGRVDSRSYVRSLYLAYFRLASRVSFDSEELRGNDFSIQESTLKLRNKINPGNDLVELEARQLTSFTLSHPSPPSSLLATMSTVSFTPSSLVHHPRSDIFLSPSGPSPSTSKSSYDSHVPRCVSRVEGRLDPSSTKLTLPLLILPLPHHLLLPLLFSCIRPCRSKDLRASRLSNRRRSSKLRCSIKLNSRTTSSRTCRELKRCRV